MFLKANVRLKPSNTPPIAHGIFRQTHLCNCLYLCNFTCEPVTRGTPPPRLKNFGGLAPTERVFHNGNWRTGPWPGPGTWAQRARHPTRPSRVADGACSGPTGSTCLRLRFGRVLEWPQFMTSLVWILVFSNLFFVMFVSNLSRAWFSFDARINLFIFRLGPS